MYFEKSYAKIEFHKKLVEYAFCSELLKSIVLPPAIRSAYFVMQTPGVCILLPENVVNIYN